MPDSYLHQRTAYAAAKRCQYLVPCDASFVSGANGPDPLFAYGLFQKKPLFSDDTLGHQLHNIQTAKLLCAMAKRAVTPAQRSFTAGFATHAALDEIVHPYILWQTERLDAAPHSGKHCALEAALDTWFYRYDRQKRFGAARPAELCPVLLADQLADQCALLRDVVLDATGQALEVLELSDCYHRFAWAHRFFYSPFGIKKLLCRLIDLLLHMPDKLTGHTQPTPLPLLPVWPGPDGPVFFAGELLPAAEKKAAMLLTALTEYWQGAISETELACRFESNRFMCGAPCERS